MYDESLENSAFTHTGHDKNSHIETPPHDYSPWKERTVTEK